MKIKILEFKSELGAVEKNFATAEKLIESAKNADVLILPELWSTGYYPTPIENFADKNCERTKNFIGTLAKKFSVNIIGGSVIAEENNKFFNRCIVANRAGEIICEYDKAHLFSFSDENKIFTAGNEIKIFEFDKIKCGVAICYDLRFPEFIRKIALQGIEILFIPAAWSLKRNYARKILSRARAIENQIFLVFANSAGESEIINPAGEEILNGEIDLNLRKKIIANMDLLADRNIFTD